MLILSRKVGETIVVEDQIRVTVLGIKGGQVRIGMEAPAEVTIHREEIYNRIKAEQERSEESQEAQSANAIQFRF